MNGHSACVIVHEDNNEIQAGREHIITIHSALYPPTHTVTVLRTATVSVCVCPVLAIRFFISNGSLLGVIIGYDRQAGSRQMYE